MTIGVFSTDKLFPYMSDFQHLSFSFGFQLLNFNFLLLSEESRTADTLLNLSDLSEVCSLETYRPNYTNLQFLKENVASFTDSF